MRYAPLATNATPKAGQPFNVRGIQLAGGITLEEIGKRQNLLKDLDTKFDAIRANDFETAIVFNADGTTFYRKRGGRNYVSFSQEEVATFRGKVFTHNHGGG